MASACWDVDVPKNHILPFQYTHMWAQDHPCRSVGLPSLVGPQHHPGDGLDSSSQSSKQATITQGHSKTKYLPIFFFILEAERSPRMDTCLGGLVGEELESPRWDQP